MCPSRGLKMRFSVSQLIGELREWADAVNAAPAFDWPTQYIRRLVLCNFAEDFASLGFDLHYEFWRDGRLVWFVAPVKGVVSHG